MPDFSHIAAEESRTNAAYGKMPTPDEVQNVVLPTDGLIVVAFSALWKESAVNAARAAIFVGNNQMQARLMSNAANVVSGQEARISTVADQYNLLTSLPLGLAGVTTNAAAPSDVNTGQALAGMAGDATSTVKIGFANGSTPSWPGPDVVGGLCLIRAAAGTYTVSVQFKTASGSVTVKERRLWVTALFGNL